MVQILFSVLIFLIQVRGRCSTFFLICCLSLTAVILCFGPCRYPEHVFSVSQLSPDKSCCWPTSAQLFLVLSPIRTHENIFFISSLLLNKTILTTTGHPTPTDSGQQWKHMLCASRSPRVVWWYNNKRDYVQNNLHSKTSTQSTIHFKLCCFVYRGSSHPFYIANRCKHILSWNSKKIIW